MGTNAYLLIEVGETWEPVPDKRNGVNLEAERKRRDSVGKYKSEESEDRIGAYDSTVAASLCASNSIVSAISP